MLSGTKILSLQKEPLQKEPTERTYRKPYRSLLGMVQKAVIDKFDFLHVFFVIFFPA